MVVEPLILAIPELIKLGDKIAEFIRKRKERKEDDVKAVMDNEESVEGKVEGITTIHAKKYLVVHTKECETSLHPIWKIDRVEFPYADREVFEEDRRILTAPSPEEEAKEEIGTLAEEDDEIMTVLEILRERGELEVDEISIHLSRAGFETPIRFVRRLLRRLDAVNAVERVDLDRYKLSGIGRLLFIEA